MDDCNIEASSSLGLCVSIPSPLACRPTGAFEFPSLSSDDRDRFSRTSSPSDQDRATLGFLFLSPIQPHWSRSPPPSRHPSGLRGIFLKKASQKLSRRKFSLPEMYLCAFRDCGSELIVVTPFGRSALAMLLRKNRFSFLGLCAFSNNTFLSQPKFD